MSQCPAAMEALEPPQRLRLWTGIFRRFFPWVWAAVTIILARFAMMERWRVTGYVIVMTVIGVLMSLIFVHIYFAPSTAGERSRPRTGSLRCAALNRCASSSGRISHSD